MREGDTASSEDRYTFEDLDTLFDRLRRNPPGSGRELDRVYRRGMLALHPDRIGDDGARFIQFQEAFSNFRREWEAGQTVHSLSRAVDPYRVLRDLGLSTELSPRSALFATLYRFRSLGLERWRIRTRPGLKRRNTAVIRTLLYWAYAYDVTLPTVLSEFLLQPGSLGIRESGAPVFFAVRKLLFRSLDLLIRYQDRKRIATKAIAIDILDYARLLLDGAGGVESRALTSVRRMEAWLRREFEGDPETIGLDV